MKTKFKIGQKVYDYIFFRNTKGIVKDIKEVLGKTIVEVDFSGIIFRYSYDGKLIDRLDNRFITFTPTLSTKPYTLENFTQEEQIDWEKFEGVWGIFYDEGKAKVIGKLNGYYPDSRVKEYFSCEQCDENGFEFYQPLTEEQTKILNL